MKAIMISIKPKWCAKIMNGEKTIEVRKNKALANAIQKLINEYGYAEIYAYCTKDKKHKLEYCDINDGCWCSNDGGNYYNGKVIFKFSCYKVVPIVMQMGVSYGYGNNGYIGYGHCEKDNFKFMFDMEKETCLEHNEELCKYLNNGKNFDDIYINKLKANDGYAIHISNLEIFDEPKELNKFLRWTGKRIEWFAGCPKVKVTENVTRAPANFCYVEVEE